MLHILLHGKNDSCWSPKFSTLGRFGEFWGKKGAYKHEFFSSNCSCKLSLKAVVPGRFGVHNLLILFLQFFPSDPRSADQSYGKHRVAVRFHFRVKYGRYWRNFESSRLIAEITKGALEFFLWGWHYHNHVTGWEASIGERRRSCHLYRVEANVLE